MFYVSSTKQFAALLFSVMMFFLALQNFCFVAGVLTGVGSIETCLDSGRPGSIPCSKKWVLTLAVENGATKASSSLSATQVVFGNSSENSAVESSSNTDVAYAFKYQLYITLTKSRIRLEYPLYYLRDFNNQPYEIVYKYNSNGPLNWLDNQCMATWGSSEPTCGYAYNPPGSTDPSDRILYSQGFCCDCNAADLLGLSPNRIRGGLDCNLLSLDTPTESAHCLRFDALWYSAFQIGEPITNFEIVVNITKCAPSQGVPVSNITSSENSAAYSHNCTSDFIFLSPGSPTGYATNGKISAEAVGDFAPWVGTASYSEKYFFVPALCTDASEDWCMERISYTENEIERWMLINTDLVTTNGDECDKIGVSYSAFTNEGQRCERPTQSCLHDQLQHYYNADLAAEQSGAIGNYFVQFFGDFVTDGLTTSNPLLRFYTNRTQATEVVLQFAADEIFYTVYLAPARFIRQLSSIRPFTSQSRGGVLHLTFVSEGLGTNAAQFTVSASCQPNIDPIAAQIVTLSPGQLGSVEMPIIETKSTGGEGSCNCTLRNALGEVLDVIVLDFNSSSVKTTLGSQGGSTSTTAGNLTHTGSSAYPSSGCGNCGGLLDIACNFSNVCILNILFFIGLIAFTLLLLCCCRNCIWRCCCCCCGLLNRGFDIPLRRIEKSQRRGYISSISTLPAKMLPAPPRAALVRAYSLDGPKSSNSCSGLRRR
ncbi:hypothetical protein CCYA_CCYA10G2919 [Cyanidiococcus yangmingshanensis]|nr:hypothetical protein CCYA_CCYA10G2919 [Cyanidiococcus yangmingshanensis]